MKNALRLPAGLFAFFFCSAASAFQMGQTDYTKAQTTTIQLRSNLSLIQIKTPQDLNNILVLSGPEGYLLVDHPEAVAGPVVRKELERLGKASGAIFAEYALALRPCGGQRNLWAGRDHRGL